MTEVRARRFCAGIAIACASALAAACGNYHPNHITFTFTPFPVKVEPSGTPVSFYPDCELFIADEVVIRFDVKERKSLERWLDDIGFAIVVRGGLPGDAEIFYLVRVPLGSVPDAITLIKKQRGVRIAEENGLGHFPEDPPLGTKFFDCKPTG